jgi:hypothetical protein
MFANSARRAAFDAYWSALHGGRIAHEERLHQQKRAAWRAAAIWRCVFIRERSSRILTSGVD